MIKAWIALLGCFLVAALAAAATSDPPPIKVIDRYDHISTGFVLDGRHAEDRLRIDAELSQFRLPLLRSSG